MDSVAYIWVGAWCIFLGLFFYAGKRLRGGRSQMQDKYAKFLRNIHPQLAASDEFYDRLGNWLSAGAFLVGITLLAVGVIVR